jgi:hypothetical protein
MAFFESCNSHWNFESQFPNPRFSIKSAVQLESWSFNHNLLFKNKTRDFECAASCNNSMHYATIKPLTSKNIRQKNKQTKDWKLTSTLCCLLLFNYKAPMAATNCWELENKRWHPIETSQNWSSKKATTMCKNLMNKEELVTRQWWLVTGILQNQASYLENAWQYFGTQVFFTRKISRSNQEWPKFNYVV